MAIDLGVVGFYDLPCRINDVRRHGSLQSGVLSRGHAVRPGLAAWECAHEVWESALMYSPPPSSCNWLCPLIDFGATASTQNRRRLDWSQSSLLFSGRQERYLERSHLLPPSSFFLRGWRLLCVSYCRCAAATYISCWFAWFAASDIFDLLLLTCCSPIGLGVEALHIRRYFDANRVLASCWTTD
jgi:hypothetical protein